MRIRRGRDVQEGGVLTGVTGGTPSKTCWNDSQHEWSRPSRPCWPHAASRTFLRAGIWFGVAPQVAQGSKANILHVCPWRRGVGDLRISLGDGGPSR